MYNENENNENLNNNINQQETPYSAPEPEAPSFAAEPETPSFVSESEAPSFASETEAPSFVSEPEASSVISEPVASSIPEKEERHEINEIIYDGNNKNGEYRMTYLTTPVYGGKRKKGMPGVLKGILIAIAILVAVSMAFAGALVIANKLIEYDFGFRKNESPPYNSGIISHPNAQNTNKNDNQDAAVNDNVFQMDVPPLTVETPSDSTETEEVVSLQEGTALTVNQIAQKCTKSSVGILVETKQYYFGSAYSVSGVGSGFILSEDGYIATNNHVIENATKITVVLNDGSEYIAEIIGADSITDIAVIKIDAHDLPVLERGNSDGVLVGDHVVAIGTPASIELAGTVTDGIVSAVNRKIDITDNYGRVLKTMTLIQTNATINPGNSGGPLINQFGQVIGINTMKLTDEYEGIGFAIPINGAIHIMNQLIEDGSVTDRSDGLVTGKASLGIQCVDITEEESDYYGIPQGVLVMQINKNGSAAKAGLRRGDIIIAFDGKEVKTTDEITALKEKYNVGDVVTLRVYRDGDGEKEFTFALDMQSQ